MSGDPEQEYFSDGISEDITTDLSKVSALGVVARNTAFTFKGRSVNVREVSQEARGQPRSGRQRAQGGRAGAHQRPADQRRNRRARLGRSLRPRLDDIFAIQDEISKAIVAALKLKLMPAEKKAIEQRGTTNAEAYNLYLLARQYWVTGNQGDPRREERVMRICSKAVEIDPYYAQAWALLAIAQSNLRYGFGQQVDDGYAAAHTALGDRPEHRRGPLRHGAAARGAGTDDDALAELEKGLALNPESWELNKAIANFFIYRGRIADATRHFETGRRGDGHRLSTPGAC